MIEYFFLPQQGKYVRDIIWPAMNLSHINSFIDILSKYSSCPGP